MIKRFLMIAPIVLVSSFLAFLLINGLPGDAARSVVGEGGTPEQVAYFRELMGLNVPMMQRYWGWLLDFFPCGLLRGFLAPAYQTTLTITLIATALSLLIGVPLGFVSAFKRHTIYDRIFTFLSLTGMSMPSFWQASLIYIFLLSLARSGIVSRELFIPGPGRTFFLIIAAIILGISLSASVMRMTRASVLEIVSKNYIRTARAFGVSEGKIITKHIMHNVGITILTIVGTNFNTALAGSFYTEIIFGLEGMGQLIVWAVRVRNELLLLNIVVLLSTCYCIVNLIVDIGCAFVDPRIKNRIKKDSSSHRDGSTRTKFKVSP